MTTLAGKVAVITGGSKGIGRATALRFAQDGAKVVIQYNSDSRGDAASVADTEKLIRAAVEKFQHIDILIANAGSLPYKDLLSTSEEDFRRCINLNVKGPYFLIQKAAAYLRPGASIILVSSTLCHASTVTPRYLLYLSTKGAIEQMVRVLAKEFGPKEITVNAVAPGPTDTVLFNNGANEAVLTAMNNMNPRGRLGTPEDIAETMAFLGSPASGWVSGQILRVNGGMA
ncbi:NAD(P)-binding protein [Penicillium capsulatum]|uniref:NAD(P)-binding protein n=1 Tax=Penicillium capsulatum TaxID=69766 RepID=A0A9W9LWZ9_9EURO|nr:NAD(P)-binding protein [Penicillium capsulatum]KAJ6122357.1 NAD(P)-binding protein [Penicillium capsulatum]